MRIDQSNCNFQIINGFLKVTSQDGFASIPLDPLFIKSGPQWILNIRQSFQGCRDVSDWSLIDINYNNGAVAKTHLISLRILQTIADKEQAHRDKLIVEMALEGNTERVKSLLARGSISDEVREMATIGAASNGRLEIIRSLLESGSISEPHRGLAVIQAAAGWNAEIAQLLLASGSILKEHRGQAVLQAALNRTGDLLTLLLANGAEISEKHRGEAVLQATHAIFFGNTNVASSLLLPLLTSGPISNRHRGEAIVEFAAVEKPEYLPAITSCIEPLMRGSFSEQHRGQAIIKALQKGSSEIAQLLLRGESISEEDRGLAAVQAAAKGKIDIIRLLFKDGKKISNEDRGLAVIEAVKIENVEIIQFLLASGPILDKHRGGAVVAAASNLKAGYKDNGFIDLLLAGGRVIPEECRGKALVMALREKHTDIARALLANGEAISSEDRGLAIVLAALLGYNDIIGSLKGPISDDHLAKALVYADKNQGKITRALLLNNRTMPYQAIEKALYHQQKAATARSATAMDSPSRPLHPPFGQPVY